MRRAPVGRGPRHERADKAIRENSVAHALPCPYNANCGLDALTDDAGQVQAVMCHLCAFLERRSDLHDALTGTPGVGA